MMLRALIEHLDVLDVAGDLDVEVSSIARDSRAVGGTDLFVAIQGNRFDAHDAVPGLSAAAVVVQRSVAVRPGVTVVRVADTRAALAALAAAFHGHPASSLQTVGVTGTNGKTTVCTLVDGAFAALGTVAGRIGTTGACVGGVPLPSSLTTPDPLDLHRLLGQMRDAGAGIVAMEVSSIGLDQRRVAGIAFDVAVFTNLSRDHLDVHGSMAAYAAAKGRLFRELLRDPGGLPRALLFGDDPAWRSVDPPDDRWLYGSDPGHDLYVHDVRLSATSTRFRLRTPMGVAEVDSSVIGRFNVMNLAASVGVLLLLGVELKAAAAGVSAAPGPVGRLEPVEHSGSTTVLVDYAHTPDALAGVLAAVGEVSDGAVWVVFGCGGDRDRGKRPQMGRASLVADRVVITSDNPRSEDPAAIAADILVGAVGDHVQVELDRAAAIALALRGAGPHDVVLLAGKGHETTQDIGGKKLPFDDRVVARRLLEGA